MSNDTIALELLLEDYLEQIRELVQQAKGSEPDFSQVAAAIATLRYPTSEEIAQSIAKVVRFPAPTDLTPMLERVAKALEHLEKQRPQASPVGYGNNKVEVRNFPETTEVSNFPATQAVSSSTLATEVTLAAVLDATANVEDALHAEVANIAANAWTTVVSYTPTVASTVLGFNADVSGLTDIIYRMRLTVGGVVKCSETIGASANSWIPIKSDVAAGTPITIDVFHGEAVVQTFRASLSYGS